MLWSDFKAAVLVDLPMDNSRIGIATGNPNYLQQQLLYAVIKIQQLIPFYQKGHETVYGSEDLVLEGLASVGSLPQTEQARPVDAYYKKTGRQCVSQPLIPYDWGNRYDLICGNPRINNCQFLIAIDPHGQQFTVFPRVTPFHQISLTWDGVKTGFNDADVVPFDMDVVEAVGLFVKGKIARLVDHDLAESGSYFTEFNRKTALLYADAKDRTRMSATAASPAQSNKCANSLSVCGDSGADCANPDVEDEDTVEFCAFGDSGETGTIQNTFAVSNLVKSLEPDFVMQMGDIIYPDGNPVLIQDNLIKYYGLYIPQAFYFAYGNHDIQTDGGAALASLFTVQAGLNGGKRYYDFLPQNQSFINQVPGLPKPPSDAKVHIFVLDTNLSSPADEQFAWLRTQLAASTDFWNIVTFHEPPYTSDVNHYPGNLLFRQDYKGWGAHMVISGHAHNYERIQVDGFPYIICGLGGAQKRGFVNTPVAGSQFRYNDFYGCLYITARRDQLQVSFYDTRGEQIDSIALQRAVPIVAP